jgi:rare lipoprotein A (peptidoglycan hydrolase)
LERQSSRPRDLDRRPRRRARGSVSGPRPDLVAAWAVALGVFLILVASATSQGSTGGTSGTGSGGATQPPSEGSGDDSAAALRLVQTKLGLPVTGIASAAGNRTVAAQMPAAVATWYGPGLFGRRTACGILLRRSTIGVAHRRLPCGTRVIFYYRGIFRSVPVIDRGPYGGTAAWDLTAAAARNLGLRRTARLRVIH